MRIRSLLATAASTGVAVLAVAGCGSSTTTTTVTVSQSTANTAPTTPSASSSTAASAPATQTTSTESSVSTRPAAGRAAPCRAGGLALTYLGQQGATGHGVIGLALRNTSGSSCHTFGFPGVLWLSKTGSPLPTHAVRTTHDFFGPAPLASLTVTPGGRVSFRLGVTHGAGGTAGCATAYGLQVIAPDDTATMRVTIPDGAFECRTTTVSPVRPGTSAYTQ
jgi:Protein of unknown function (DUF4232)